MYGSTDLIFNVSSEFVNSSRRSLFLAKFICFFFLCIYFSLTDFSPNTSLKKKEKKEVLIKQILRRKAKRKSHFLSYFQLKDKNHTVKNYMSHLPPNMGRL